MSQLPKQSKERWRFLRNGVGLTTLGDRLSHLRKTRRTSASVARTHGIIYSLPSAAIWLLAFSLLIIANDTYLVFSGVPLLRGFHIVTAAFGLIALVVGTLCAWLLFSQKGHEVLVKPKNQRHGKFVLDIEQLYQVVKSSLILAIIIF